MASIRKIKSKNGTIKWTAKVVRKGHPKKYATFKLHQDAKKWADKTETDILELRYFGKLPSRNYTFNELADKYIKDIIPSKGRHGKIQLQHLNWWKKELGHMLLQAVTAPVITESKNRLMGKDYTPGKKFSNATIVRYLGTLSCLFTFAVDELEWAEKSPVSKVKKPKEPRGIVRYLNESEKERLLQACKDSKNIYLYTVVTIAISIGMRLSEIMNLTWDDVDFENRTIIIHKTKNGERRPVPLVHKAFDTLLMVSEMKMVFGIKTNLVFPSTQKPWSRGRRKPQYIDKAWKAALEESGVKNFRFHDLRHTCASYMAMEGA